MATCCKKLSGWFFFGIAVGFISGLLIFSFKVYEHEKSKPARNKNCPPGTTQCEPIVNYEIGNQS
jgi:hypothetical protein